MACSIRVATASQADPGQLRARLTDTAATLPGSQSQRRNQPIKAMVRTDTPAVRNSQSWQHRRSRGLSGKRGMSRCL
jgi:hypothetical protein